LEQNELTNIDDVTIYTFLYPIESLHPDAANKSRSIWCAPNRVKAWNDWIFNNQLPSTAGKCDVPLERVGEMARKYGVTSTPTLFLRMVSECLVRNRTRKLSVTYKLLQKQVSKFW